MAGNLKKNWDILCCCFTKAFTEPAYIDQRTDCFVQYSSTPPKDRTAIHLGPSKITYGRHKLYSGDKPARSKVAIADSWT